MLIRLYEIPNSENLCLYISHHKVECDGDKSNYEGSENPVGEKLIGAQYAMQKGVRDRYVAGWLRRSKPRTD